MIFRRYVADDFPALYAIEERCFEPRFRFGRSYMLSLLKTVESSTWIAEEDGVIVGFATVAWSRNARKEGGYLQTIEVLPEMRGRGVGEKLLSLAEITAVTVDAQTMALHVDAQNRAAIRLYERCGYKRRGRREHYYARGRAALLYVKQLEPVEMLGMRTLAMGYSAA